MNNRQIEVFAAVMKAGTVSRAAEILGVTQPGVSRLIAELERSLGFALFDRVRNRIVPTLEGRTFFAEVEADFRGMDRLRASAARIRDYGAGQLRVATLSALSSSIVPNAVLRFAIAARRDRHADGVAIARVRPLRARTHKEVGTAGSV